MDGDCEGEVIVWYLLEIFKLCILVKWMVFYEIIELVICVVVEYFCDLDIDLVDVQEIWCILDWLYGYEVSLVLWKKVVFKLLVGWVQLVVICIIVVCECDCMVFCSVVYWDIFVKLDVSVFDLDVVLFIFSVWLMVVVGWWVVIGCDFDLLGMLCKGDEVIVFDEGSVIVLVVGLDGMQLIVVLVEEKFYVWCLYLLFMIFMLQ